MALGRSSQAAYLPESQFDVKGGRPVMEPRPSSVSRPSEVMFSESEPPSRGGVL